MRTEGIRAGFLEEESLHHGQDFLHYISHRMFRDLATVSSESVGMSSTFS